MKNNLLRFISGKIFTEEVVPFDPETEKVKGKGFRYNGQEFIHYSGLPESNSAFRRLSGIQIVVLLSFAILLVEALIFDWHSTLVIFFALFTFLYFIDLLFNLFLIYRSFKNSNEIQITDTELESVPYNHWPKYTVLCPLYKEAHVLPQFVDSMSALDYPKDQLQIMLILEEDDLESIEKIREYNLPSYFDIVIVPDSLPKTKPKACNYGLLHAKGEYTVIFDAEDIPDPLQLKKAVLAFEKAGDKTKCIQAKLNFYNPYQNLLTRVFTAEYSVWFDLVLTGLQSINAPIPLGGTSNHFRTNDLHKLKGWDAFNVTEDCDLGMRLVKQGYRTAVIDSTTLEEANSSVKNWFWQRTRWIKGYMQTYLLHMRDPHEFIQNWKDPHVLTFQLVVGGKVMSMFINPLMWVITICYFLYRTHVAGFIESFFPTPVLYVGVFSLLVGNFLYMYYYMIGCVKHGHHKLVKYIVFVPFYWLAMSAAAWVALYKLIVAPHQWSKTKHGLHLLNKKAAQLASAVFGGFTKPENTYKPTVGICIPAYNEENNIGNLLQQLIAQDTKSFILEEIYVISDGSTDNTVNVARQYENQGVKVYEGKINRGVAYRQNEILSKISTDILVLLNADISLGDVEVISRLIAPLLKGADLSAQYASPIRPWTFLERILHAGFELKYFVYPHYKNGNNIYTCVGHIRALSKRFYTNIIFPEVSEGEDQYLYLACIKGGYKYEHANKVNVYFKLRDNCNDYKKYAKRIFQTQKKYGDIFSEKLARTERKLPFGAKLSGCMHALFKKPLYTPLYIMLHIFVEKWALMQPVNSDNVYEISRSTKVLSSSQL